MRKTISGPSPVASLGGSSGRVRGCGVLIVVSEPSPIAALEGSSGRVRECDVEMLASNSLRYFRLFLGSLLIHSWSIFPSFRQMVLVIRAFGDWRSSSGNGNWKNYFWNCELS